MTDEDNKKANVLVTFRFPDNSSFSDDVDTEILVQSKIAKVMHKLTEEEKISHFVVGNDDIIQKKLADKITF